MKNMLIDEAAEYLKKKIAKIPETVLVLGSGLGQLANEIESLVIIDYKEIPGFPRSTAPGHASRLIIGELDHIPVLVFQGRFHLYEGYTPDEIAFPFRTISRLGCRNVILTNAAGGINRSFKPGNIMIIRDHINFTNRTLFEGPFFQDLTKAYDKHLRDLLKRTAQTMKIPLKEGVYGWTGGPSFESASEIKMMRILGADAVGMSTVPEVITACKEGMKVLALSCISNMACGILDQPITEEEVIETGKRTGDQFARLLKNFLKTLEDL